MSDRYKRPHTPPGPPPNPRKTSQPRTASKPSTSTTSKPYDSYKYSKSYKGERGERSERERGERGERSERKDEKTAPASKIKGDYSEEVYKGREVKYPERYGEAREARERFAETRDARYSSGEAREAREGRFAGDSTSREPREARDGRFAGDRDARDRFGEAREARDARFADTSRDTRDARFADTSRDAREGRFADTREPREARERYAGDRQFGDGRDGRFADTTRDARGFAERDGRDGRFGERDARDGRFGEAREARDGRLYGRYGLQDDPKKYTLEEPFVDKAGRYARSDMTNYYGSSVNYGYDRMDSAYKDRMDSGYMDKSLKITDYGRMYGQDYYDKMRGYGPVDKRPIYAEDKMARRLYDDDRRAYADYGMRSARSPLRSAYDYDPYSTQPRSPKRPYLDRYVIGDSVVYGSPGHYPRDLQSPSRRPPSPPSPQPLMSIFTNYQPQRPNPRRGGASQNSSQYRPPSPTSRRPPSPKSPYHRPADRYGGTSKSQSRTRSSPARDRSMGRRTSNPRTSDKRKDERSERETERERNALGGKRGSDGAHLRYDRQYGRGREDGARREGDRAMRMEDRLGHTGDPHAAPHATAQGSRGPLLRAGSARDRKSRRPDDLRLWIESRKTEGVKRGSPRPRGGSGVKRRGQSSERSGLAKRARPDPKRRIGGGYKGRRRALPVKRNIVKKYRLMRRRGAKGRSAKDGAGNGGGGGGGSRDDGDERDDDAKPGSSASIRRVVKKPKKMSHVNRLALKPRVIRRPTHKLLKDPKQMHNDKESNSSPPAKVKEESKTDDKDTTTTTTNNNNNNNNNSASSPAKQET